MRDFTVKKYKSLLQILLDRKFSFLNVQQALANKDIYSKEKVAVVRHDIDTKHDLSIALAMAKFEAANNISASYYFRTIPDVFDKKVIISIFDLGHEIGYHYEVLALMDGDLQKGIEWFKKDLKLLRNICPISTICQHGGTLGPYSSTSVLGLLKTGIALLSGKINMKYYPSIQLWDKYKLDDFELAGDAYLSFDFERIKYFSDTGLSWDSHGTRIVDNVSEGNNIELSAHSTDDLIALISDGKIKRINLLVHPANWNDPILRWFEWRILQSIRNISKKIIKRDK
jgi:hypothetical protein